MKKTICLLLAVLFAFSTNTIFAEERTIHSSVIPAKMEPYSKIRYIDSDSFVILSGDVVFSESDYSNEGIPSPVAGVIVEYASDGFILDIQFPEGIDNPLLSEQEYVASSNNTTRYVVPEGHTLVATWGAHHNALYQSSSLGTRIGWGRATTFSDTIGQANITNYKGSVATKLSYDNIPVNTTVYVKTPNINGVSTTKAMTKTDAGGMPDAILDIWKTGVEYWGYTWSSSFSMPNTVEINHAY